MARLIALSALALILVAACLSVAPPASEAPSSSLPVASASIEPTETPAHTATTPATPATPSATAEPPTATPSRVPTPTPSLAPTPTASPPTPAPQPTPRPPRIRIFSAPAFVDCSVDPEPLQIRLEWQIRRGTGVTLSIDGPGVYATYEGRTGAADVPFSCSEDEHAYQLETIGGVGEPDIELRVVRRTQPG